MEAQHGSPATFPISWFFKLQILTITCSLISNIWCSPVQSATMKWLTDLETKNFTVL